MEHITEEREAAQGVRFTREELSEKVKVPAIVEQDLKRIISDRLEQCGLYYRVFSRIKTPASMERKFAAKEYGEGKKLQDLVGVRINLYFDDDVKLCQSIMERTFEAIDWSASKRNEDEFKPAKLNGVFRLPEYLKERISPATWEMSIDDTFEVQIKTIFFEGWHEIEHDMRYKGEELWSGYAGFSRYFNSILATLELCDKSMVRLFEDLGHALYLKGRFADMIRSHFRLKLADAALYPEVEEVLREDKEQTVDSLAKRIYKTEKSVVVDQLLRRVRRVPINVNTIIAILNDSEFHDPRLTEIFRSRDVYNDGREESISESRHYQLKPLSGHKVFGMRTWVDGNRLKNTQARDVNTIFEKTSGTIYRWLVSKFGELFLDMPQEPCSWEGAVPGYRVYVRLEPAKLKMEMKTEHLDLEAGGRIWNAAAKLAAAGSRILLEVENGYAEPLQEHDVPIASGTVFSYPGFYKAVVDSVGIFNGIECSNRRRILREDQADELVRAIKDPERQFPLILIVSRETEDGMMDENWLGQFRVSDFTRTVWRYAHVFTTYEETGRGILKACGTQTGLRDAVPGVYLFWPGAGVDSYGPEDVANCTFGRHLEARDDARTYDIVRGGQAFYHQIVADLRDHYVTG